VRINARRAENSGPARLYNAVRLADYFGNSARFWLGLQMDYDLEEARKKLHAA